jgi:metal-responsive CopG/Arc/MetJ family transcriptional regulator
VDNSVTIPVDLLRKVDQLVEHLDFASREAFVEAALRRLIDHYTLMLRPLKTAKD